MTISRSDDRPAADRKAHGRCFPVNRAMTGGNDLTRLPYAPGGGKTTSAYEEFCRHMACADDAIPLAQVALAIARIQYPMLDSAACMRELAAIENRARASVPQDVDIETAVSTLSHVLFVDERFRGNVENYYAADNSCLNRVLDSRQGIPITLAVIYLEIAWRLGFVVEGIGFPGHFLVSWELDEGIVVVDPFSAGATLGPEELTILARRAGVTGDPLEYLVSASRRQIVVRMLRNLCGIYARDDLHSCQLEVLNMLLHVDPDSAPELVVRAELLQSLDCTGAALDDMTRLRDIGLTELPDGRDINDEIRRLAVERPVTH